MNFEDHIGAISELLYDEQDPDRLGDMSYQLGQLVVLTAHYRLKLEEGVADPEKESASG